MVDKTQKGVARGAAPAVLTCVAGLVIAASLTPYYLEQSVTLHDRLRIAAFATLAPILSLIFCIARLANHRFFTAEDINGSGLTHGTDRAKLLQALLQNTLEQATIAIAVYFCGAVVFPRDYLGALVAGGVMFLIGRIAFFVGYKNGAPSRAFGFGLTFYPTVFLIAGAIYFLVMGSGL